MFGLVLNSSLPDLPDLTESAMSLEVLPYCKLKLIDEDLLERINRLRNSDNFPIIGSS
jgi:hypothetical protein